MTFNNGELIPDEGMYLQNIHTNEAYESYIYPAKSLTETDFREITEKEYQTIISNSLDENLSEVEQKAQAYDIITGGAR